MVELTDETIGAIAQILYIVCVAFGITIIAEFLSKLLGLVRQRDEF